MKTKGFIKNLKLLQETPEVPDLLNFSEYIRSFEQKLSSIDKPALVGLIGPYGIGKSTMLYQIMDKRKRSKKEKWIKFEAWSYPNRKLLWEGLLLEMVQQTSELSFLEKKMKGKSGRNFAIELFKAILSSARLGGLTGLLDLFRELPPEAMVEFQKLFLEGSKKLLKRQDFFLIIEDADRSGEEGLFFLETLSYFIRNILCRENLKKKFIVIALIGSENFQKETQRYLKFLDYAEFFYPKISHFEEFIEQIFDPDFLENEEYKPAKDQLASFFMALFQEFPQTMSPRLLKTILRKANIVYQQQLQADFQADFRVTICVEASKFLKNEKGETFFEIFQKNKMIHNDTVFASFLAVICDDIANVYKNEANIGTGLRYPTKPFLLNDSTSRTLPFCGPDFEGQKRCWISGMYFYFF